MTVDPHELRNAVRAYCQREGIECTDDRVQQVAEQAKALRRNDVAAYIERVFAYRPELRKGWGT